jgi:putative ABC transport system ATP-binding protein
MNQKPVVDINNFNYYFGKGTLKKQILFDINQKIYEGEIVIVTGPFGSGKTTLLTLIGGLRSPQEGSLKVLCQQMKGATKNQLVKVRRHIGYIFQAHNLLLSLTARQNVQMSVELHPEISQPEAEKKSVAMLEAVGLGN